MAAIRFLGENKEEFRLNLDWAFLTGDSAGALLCLFVLSLQNSEKLREADGTEVNLPEF